MLTKMPGILLLALALPPLAVSQSTPDLQKILERLDQLESQNQHLLEEIRALRSELEHNAQPVTVAAPQPDAPVRANAPVEERLAVAENRIAELDQAKVTASQRFPISLTGMLLFNAFDNGRSGTSQNPVTAALFPGASADGGSVRQTIIGLRFNGPTLVGGGTATGSIYFDFLGGSSAPSNNLLRIRTASMDLNWGNTTVSVGQDKPLISPRDPSSFAQVAVSPLTAAGNLWDWNPQVRLEHRFRLGENAGLTAQGSVYEMTDVYSSSLPSAYAGTLERLRPSYQGRLEFFRGGENRRVEVASGFSIGNTHVAGRSIQSTITSLDWLIRPLRKVEFSGEAFRGQDVSGLGALQGFNVLESGLVNAVHTHGEWGQLALFPASRLSVHVYAGEQYNRPSDISGASIQRNFVYAGNLMYKLAPNVLAAIEASQTRTEYLGSLLRLNNHYDLALAYLF